jgi:hypothetical protein
VIYKSYIDRHRSVVVDDIGLDIDS